jgi:hypothetical protein
MSGISPKVESDGVIAAGAKLVHWVLTNLEP